MPPTPTPTPTIAERGEKLAKWLDFQFGGPQIGNQVRGLVAAVREDERAKVLEACEAALTKDAMPDVWWFVGEAINRIRSAVDRLPR